MHMRHLVLHAIFTTSVAISFSTLVACSDGSDHVEMPSNVVAAAPGPTVPPELPMAPWAKRVTGYLPARDGTLLKYSVLLPAQSGSFPTIVNYSGYDPGSIGGSSYEAGDTTMSPELDAKLLAAGYAILGVNMAGTACSDGVFDLFGRRWSTDGYDAVEWAAQQDWSDGNIGMANWSYAGLSQYLTAIEQPPHLRAIAPGMLVTDPWRDVGFPGGVTNFLFPERWWLFIQIRWTAALSSAESEGDDKCIANIGRNKVVAQQYSPPVVNGLFPYPEGEMQGYPVVDRQTYDNANQVKVPVFSVVSWQDEATGPRGGYFQDALDPKTSYLIGMNGPHDTYASKLLHENLLRFFDRYVKGINNGIEEQPHVQLWQNTTGESLDNILPRAIISVDRLPVPIRPLELSLRDGGILSIEPAVANEASQSYSYPVDGPTLNGLFPLATDWEDSLPSATGSISYTTARLANTLAFFGPASADLWISSSAASDADIQVTVTEVRPDGFEEYVQRGWLRLSQRKQDETLAKSTRPFLIYSSSSVEALTPDEPVLARVEINRFSHVFREGSSIRIWIDAPSQTGEWDFISPEEPTELTVYSDAEHPSRLVLGLLESGDIGLPLQECGSNLGQPCRLNSVAVPIGNGPDGSSAGQVQAAP